MGTKGADPEKGPPSTPSQPGLGQATASKPGSRRPARSSSAELSHTHPFHRAICALTPRRVAEGFRARRDQGPQQRTQFPASSPARPYALPASVQAPVFEGTTDDTQHRLPPNLQCAAATQRTDGYQTASKTTTLPWGGPTVRENQGGCPSDNSKAHRGPRRAPGTEPGEGGRARQGRPPWGEDSASTSSSPASTSQGLTPSGSQT